MYRLMLILLSALALPAGAAEYIATPATLATIQTRVRAGDIVTLLEGAYPQFNEGGSARTGYVTYQAAPGAQVTVAGLRLVGAQFLRFVGLDILSSSQTVVYIRGSRGIEVSGGRIHGRRWFLSNTQGVYGVDIEGSQDVTIAGVEIYEIHRGVQVQGSARTVIASNEIRPKAGTGVQYLGGNTAGLIDDNHIVGETATGSSLASSAHASIISVRSSGLTISNNEMHGMGSSSGIMFYDPDSVGGEAAYSNITISDNLLYDTHPQAIRIYNLGDNVRVRGNIVAPGFRKAKEGTVGCAPVDPRDGRGVICDARYRYNTALIVHNLGRGASGAGLQVTDNVMIGTVVVPTLAVLSGNTMWSLQRNGRWAPASSQVLVDSAGDVNALFENGTLFTQRINYWFPGTPRVNWTPR